MPDKLFCVSLNNKAVVCFNTIMSVMKYAGKARNGNKI